jgi:hypothetical protein
MYKNVANNQYYCNKDTQTFFACMAFNSSFDSGIWLIYNICESIWLIKLLKMNPVNHIKIFDFGNFGCFHCFIHLIIMKNKWNFEYHRNVIK